MAPSGRGLHKGLVSLLCIRLGLDRVGLEGLRIGDDLLDHAEEPRRARGLLVVLEAWRRRRARRLLASDLYDSTIFIHHRFINLAKTIKMSTSDSSLSASSKRHFARDGSFSAFSSSPQISRYISRIQHVFVIALQHLASFLGTFGLYGQIVLNSSTFRQTMFSAFPGISQKLMDYRDYLSNRNLLNISATSADVLQIPADIF